MVSSSGRRVAEGDRASWQEMNDGSPPERFCERASTLRVGSLARRSAQ
jgi:hypothetical protein